MFTDGVKAMADIAGAYWLLDVVGSYQSQLRGVPFQIWRIESRERRGTVTMREDDGLQNLVEQRIPFTDFPQGVFEMYFADRVLMLKGEY